MTVPTPQAEALRLALAAIASCNPGDTSSGHVIYPSGWQPIETAPKDGTEILVYFGSMGVRQVSWDSQYAEGSDSEWAIWCVDDNKHGPYPLRGWNHNGPNAPTHWMPLPPSPAAEAAAEPKDCA